MWKCPRESFSVRVEKPLRQYLGLDHGTVKLTTEMPDDFKPH